MGDINDAKEVRTLLGQMVSLAGKYRALQQDPSFYTWATPEQVLDFTVDCFNWLVRRGVNETNFEPGLYDDWDAAGKISFADPGDPSIAWTTVFNTRVENTLGVSVLLLRDALESRNALQGPLGALKVLTKRWGHGTRWLSEQQQWFDYGMNTDQSRMLLADRLHYVLAIDAAGDEFGTRAQHLAAWRRWAERALNEDSTVHYGCKPDGSISHHRMFYGNGYGFDIIPWAGYAAHILDQSPWALSPAALENIVKAVSMVRAYAPGGDSPRSVGGRLVFSDFSFVTGALTCIPALMATVSDGALSEEARRMAVADVWFWTEVKSDTAFWTNAKQSKWEVGAGCLRAWVKTTELFPLKPPSLPRVTISS
eukprot:CAMPEP_0181289836 /NCGR_PEP_ID=MMETSP1101-20121128/1096_1 /TAXON_ID=46948 /ORGANISM="Rhodomonas abbreviata, Strain Caron Lab Isolate" /LENGTH=366 /DNA_ID=CAMNT_0023394087 /DNA_START=340 /DNA_END=1436 /DNA_ORIENTATION=+